MSRTVISVENLGKEYVIGGRENGGDTFREMIVSAAAAPFRRLQRLSGRAAPDERIWALKGVSLEVKEGEVVGIIGKNGAGKSTLLKVLSRITAPTAGRAEIRGRVSSLIEVGTGFHPELTGRENIYLNGAILGMSRAEIGSKFDEIVDFSGVEKFLDTPVKRYSSGMQVRLAFAVAAHLEPEILIVDEVLAVGDAEFQKKCLGKMQEVSGKGGRTVLLVSHNTVVVEAVCQRVVLLEGGRVSHDGNPSVVIAKYLNRSQTDVRSAIRFDRGEIAAPNGRPRALRRIWLEDASGPISSFSMNALFRVIVEFEADKEITRPGFGFGVEDEYGRRVFSFNSYMDPKTVDSAPAKSGKISLTVPALPLLPGLYTVTVSIVENEREWIDLGERIIQFEVRSIDVYRTGRIPERSQGIVFVAGEVDLRIDARL